MPLEAACRLACRGAKRMLCKNNLKITFLKVNYRHLNLPTNQPDIQSLERQSIHPYRLL